MLSDDALWYKDAIIYELHVRAFADSNGDGIGDFAGLTEKLDYLKDLGITALWLLPFYPSPLRDGGYDIADYYGVHPDYGTKEDFLRFLEAAHARDLKVITELVINHTSSDHPWFQRARRAKPGSVERDFYVWSETPEKYQGARIIFRDFETSNWTWDGVARANYWHRFYSHQPDLNFDNPAVHQALFDVVDHWMELGVDGVRLDAIPYLYEREGTTCENLPETHAFLKQLRAHVDSKFKNRMLLAEANQWPADAAAYFGDGDECHMNFHFPLMPRLFMAVNLEDSFPIVDILNQTPEIPPTCQWATFLRNHDELTLEMVTEEDRDSMYRSYASEHRARINLGIRRRLAPLLGGRRRIELLNAILFSLPGTPVLYYGDEIGMGDNIYLGDRDGVRTPMQWNSDRNGGFSRANPQRLYLPIVVDPQYHFEAVNVEAQQANPASLLWWMKYLIHARKRTHLFSRGTLRFVDHDNPRVLAFVREHDGQRVLFVANLSRFPQHATLLLGEYQGQEPVELFGRGRFPRIEAERWGVSLGPYDYFWFELKQPDVVEKHVHEPLVVQGQWWNLAARGGEQLALRLAYSLKSRRWFRGKGREVSGQALRDVITLESEGERFLIALLRMDYVDGPSETYAMPLAFVHGAQARELEAGSPGLVVTRLSTTPSAGHEPEVGLLVDATASRAWASRMLKALAASEVVEGRDGSLRFTALEGLDAAIAGGSVDPRPVELDQTNSVVFYGTQLMLKALRVVDEGVNAEEEMSRFLTTHAKRRLSPRLFGTVSWKPKGGEPALLAIASEFVASRGTAWTLVSDALAGYFERAVATAQPPPEAGVVLAPEPSRPPDAWQVLAEHLPGRAELLARRTAELHLTLASTTDEPDFAPEPFNVLHQQSLYQNARGLVTRTFAQLKKRLATLGDADRALAERVLTREKDVTRQLHDVVEGQFDVLRVRSHGDLHLGQVLFTGDDFVFIDFEGEPARPLRERRYKRCPLRDVAGMLRSFEYASEAALREGRVRAEDRAALEPWALAWDSWMSVEYVEAYVAAVHGSRLVPPSRKDARRLLRFYLLEKCVYEVGYELNNRPGWIGIPLVGIERLLGPGWA
ncbi:MAG: maltose alpha-D-glucosyltransferase [Myxococcota bacterium]